MKRLFALTIIIVSMMLSIAPVMADEPGAELISAEEPAVQTRLDLCIGLGELLGLDEAENITPLLRYNDWSKIPREQRKLVASVIESGIFVPQQASFKPDAEVLDADMDVLSYGLTLYGMASEELSFVKGSVTGMRKNVMTLNYAGDSHKFDYSDCRFIDGVEPVTEMQLECLTDSDGNMLAAWKSRENAMSIYTVQKGSFYLYEPASNSLIVNDIKMLINNKWTATPSERYITAEVCDLTKVVCDGEVVDPAVLNDIRYLDRDASFIVGEKNGVKYMLYLELN